MGAGRDDPRLQHGVHRRLRRQRRSAGDAGRPCRAHARGAVDRQFLHADAQRFDPGRRCGRRSLRPPTSVHARHGRLRGGFGRLWARAECRDVDRGAHAAGHRWRDAGSREPCDHQRGVSAGRARTRDRHLGRRVGAHDGAGSGARRLVGGRVVMARDLFHQRADRRGRAAAFIVARSREPQSRAGQRRLVRWSAGDTGAGGNHVWIDRRGRHGRVRRDRAAGRCSSARFCWLRSCATKGARRCR